MVQGIKLKELWILRFIIVALVITLAFVLMSEPPREEKTSSCSSFEIFMGEKIKSDDPCLKQHISSYIAHPVKNVTRNRRDLNQYFSQAGQDKFVDNLLHKRIGGFFIECGAAEGERLSNTLFLERARGWTGLLVEPDLDNFKKLLSKNRSAYSINSCLSLENWPSQAVFQKSKDKFQGGLVDGFNAQHRKVLQETGNLDKQIQVQCYPLYSLLLAIGVTHIDYLSLDVEGPELSILKTIPFDKVTIDVMSIEYRVRGKKDATLQKLAEIESFIFGTGLYEFAGILPEGPPQRGLDVMFKRKDIKQA